MLSQFLKNGIRGCEASPSLAPRPGYDHEDREEICTMEHVPQMNIFPVHERALRILLFLSLFFISCLPSFGASPAGPKQADRTAKTHSFTIITDPPGAEVIILPRHAGPTQKKVIGISGTPMSLDRSMLSDTWEIAFLIHKDGYVDKIIKLPPSYILGRSIYPEGRPICLDHLIRQLLFRTEPGDAGIFIQYHSSPGRWTLLGRSGRPIELDLSRFATRDDYSFRINLRHYQDLEVRIPASDMIRGAGSPIERRYTLQPIVPLISPLRLFAERNPLLAIIITVPSIIVLWLLGSALFTRYRSLARDLEKMHRWEARAASISRTGSMIRKKIGGYVIVSSLGEGGTSMVYRAVPESTLDDRESVAIKILKPDVSEDPEFVERFRREVRITCELIHPHILNVLDFGEQEGVLYLVTEIIEGGTLRARLTGSPLPVEEFKKIFMPILDGVAFAHRKGIVHRDLKPDNIMITGTGVVKVMDFGIAKARRYSNITQTGTAIGTPEYMAPEQLKSMGKDDRIDQYALGIMAYEMLTGSLPFTDRNPMTVMLRHVSEAPRPPRELNPEIPAAVEAIVLRMLEKDRNRRFRDLAEVMGEMDKAIGETGEDK
jgi:hypothetical protein